MDQTGSEESKQPAGEGAKPSEPSTGEHRASSEHSGQGDSPESARRAFDLLERFSGELEEILQSLERAKGGSAPGEESPPAPERAYRPSSIHFDSSPISTRIDPNALPPVESPGATSRTAPRLLLEALFLILVAAISARTGLRPLLIVTAEAVAFLIVASIELAVAHERRRIQQLPAATPSFAAPEAQEAETTSSITAFTLEQVEPLVWLSELREAAAEADWPLAVNELPSETEDTEGAQEGATEIASERRGEVAAAPEPVPEAQLEADLEDAVSPPISEPEAETDLESTAEIPAPEAELEAGLEPEVAAEPEIEPEPESIPEVFVAEAEPEQPQRFHLFRRTSEAEAEDSLESGAETPAPETEMEFEAKTEAEPVGAESELEVELEAVSEPETELEAEPEQPRRFHLFRRETSEPETADAEIDAELSELVAEPEIEDEPEAVSEPETELEAEPEQPRRFHLFRHEASEPEAEPEPGLESGAEAEISIPASEAEIAPKSAPESAPEVFLTEIEFETVTGSEVDTDLESLSEIAAEEIEPEQRRFHLFRRETSEPEPEPEVSLESTVEIPTSEVEMQSRAEIAPEFVLEPEIESESEAEPEQPRRFHLFRHEEKGLEDETEPEPEVEPEVEPVAEVEILPEVAAGEIEPEQPRRFHLFRHEEKVLEAELEPEPEVEPETELIAEVEAPPEVAPEVAPEVFAMEAEPEQPHHFHLFRHEEKVLEAELELEAEAKEEIEPAEMTIEIDLPPETALDEIERTLEDIGRREPSLRRRRWSRGAEAEKAVAVQTLEDETANGESEVRLTAERERRRREREYLRNLRVSR